MRAGAKMSNADALKKVRGIWEPTRSVGTSNNGKTLEEFMDNCGLIWLNVSRPTRFDGTASCIDLALASSEQYYYSTADWEQFSDRCSKAIVGFKWGRDNR